MDFMPIIRRSGKGPIRYGSACRSFHVVEDSADGWPGSYGCLDPAGYDAGIHQIGRVVKMMTEVCSRLWWPCLKVLAVAVPLGLGLVGCASTVQNRWANEHDTLHRWQLKMRTMPVEIHGGFTNQNAAAIAAAVRGGTTPELYAARVPSPDAPLDKSPRVLIYIGTSYLPADDSYCRVKPRLRVAASEVGKVNVFGAICDGPRLVVRAEDRVDSVQVANPGEDAVIDKMKNRLLYAVSTSAATPSMGQ